MRDDHYLFTVRLILLAAACLLLHLASGDASAGAQTIELLPDESPVGTVLGHPELSQYQCDLRANPADTRQFAVSCKHETRFDQGERETALLHTTDAGRTWAGLLQPLSGDPDIVFDPAGRAFWSYIDISHRPHSLACRRSTDGGATWEAPRMLLNSGVDHPQSVCDRGKGRFAGSVYIAGRPFHDGGLTVVRTRDGGKTFQTTHVDLPGNRGLGFVFAPAVLSDGTLLIPLCSGQTLLTDGRGWFAGNLRELFCMRSVDGGVTFDAPAPIADLGSPANPGSGGSSENGGFAVVKVGNVERVCTVWGRDCTAAAPLMLSMSDDAGRTWTPPRAILPDLPDGSGVGSTCITSNAQGVLGIQWYAMRDEKTFDIYFTASTDGGSTFASPVRVSSQTSTEPPAEARYPGQDQVYGDTAPDGTFRLVWTDARGKAPGYVIYRREAVVTRSELKHPVHLIVRGGSGSGSYEAGSDVRLCADPAPTGKTFAAWTGAAPDSISNVSDPFATVHLSANMTLSATLRPALTYALRVINGGGGGDYAAGQLVPLRATLPPGRSFDHWNGPDGIGFTDRGSPSTQLRMPDHAIEVNPVFK